MWIRTASILLFFTMGLSACLSPSSIDLGDSVPTSSIPGVASATAPPTTIAISLTPSASPSEIDQTPMVPQAQSGPATSQPLKAKSINLTSYPPYRPQPGTPVAMANFIQPAAGCNWMGIGGQAFNLSGQPVNMLVVEVGGTLSGSDVFHLELTGNEPNLGPAGFLVTLSDHTIASSASLWILLYDLAGQPLTNKIFFSTYQDCTRNFILVNFVEVNANLVPQIRLPVIMR